MHPARTRTQLPTTLTPLEIGAEMARLRVSFNLTPHEVSERLHIRTRYITAIEEAAFERMPGKVYARGYIHTYAEFLGLDADQVATLCFSQEATAITAPTRVPMIAKQSTHMHASYWRNYSILGIGVLVATLVGSQFWGRAAPPPPDQITVAPVPEAMLQGTRTLMMPTPQNFMCLTRDAALTCFYADTISRDLAALAQAPLRFAADIDVSGLVVTAPVDAEIMAPETEGIPISEPADGAAGDVAAPMVVPDRVELPND